MTDSPQKCVFCGEQPVNKSKEHVIPHWLIEFTGVPERQWNLGYRYLGEGGVEERRFAADRFQFPACHACNNGYAGLEARSRNSIEKILDGVPVCASEWDSLLDWFDKVRVGLWLGMKMLGKGHPQLPPKFHINQRIGTKDRFILVYRINPAHEGLILHGTGDPVFFDWPSCFAITINRMIFVNASLEFLLAPRMGFPFPKVIVDDGTLTLASDFTAFYHQKVPYVRFGFWQPVIGLYQTILMDPLVEGDGGDELRFLQQHPFVQTRLTSGSTSKSVLHTIVDGSPLAYSADELVVEQALRPNLYRHGAEYVSRFFQYRKHMLESYIRSGRGPTGLMRSHARFVQWEIDHLEAEVARYA